MISRLRYQVTIQVPVESTLRGDTLKTWESGDTVWAEILPRGSRETFRQSQMIGELTHLGRIRDRADITSRTRLLWGTRVLQLVGPPERVEIKGVKLLEMACSEVE